MTDDTRLMIMRILAMAPGFLIAVVAHEAAHGWMAYRFGDDTAKNAGRLTLNPVAHYDPVGTILFPLIGVIFALPIFGWARPVPVNATRFKDIRKGIFWVSFAGPLANVFFGIFSAFCYALIENHVSPTFGFYEIMLQILGFSIQINFLLAVFNLIPLPPLDGSKMLGVFLPYNVLRSYEGLARYSFFILMGLLLLNSSGVPILSFLLAPSRYLSQGSYLLFRALL